MYFVTLFALAVGVVGVRAQVKDGCPKGVIACLDIINSSQCIEQIVIEHQQNVTRDNMINCVVSPGVSSSDLPGAQKVRDRTIIRDFVDETLTLSGKTVLHVSRVSFSSDQ